MSHHFHIKLTSISHHFHTIFKTISHQFHIEFTFFPRGARRFFFISISQRFHNNFTTSSHRLRNDFTIDFTFFLSLFLCLVLFKPHKSTSSIFATPLQRFAKKETAAKSSLLKKSVCDTFVREPSGQRPHTRGRRTRRYMFLRRPLPREGYRLTLTHSFASPARTHATHDTNRNRNRFPGCSYPPTLIFQVYIYNRQ